MHILHLTAHLGGGVGKAHAALRSAMPANIHQSYILLEKPLDRRYADEIIVGGGEVIVARDLTDVAERCAVADIVQFEFWNHPKLFECLAWTDFPPMRSVFWSHVSGLFKPVIAPGFLTAADRFVFTTPASLELGEGLAEPQASKLSSIGSGFGFQGRERPFANHPIVYLGTVDFIKMHPDFFDAVDALSHDVEVAIWGSYDADGAVAAKARAMRHPDRIRFMGQTIDPRAALLQSRIFFYPLQPDHYGTAENALIEAMSLGLVPVVLANPAECAIVEHGITGFVGQSIEQCTEILDRLLDAPGEVARIGANAAGMACERFTGERSAKAFVDLWSSLAGQPKHGHRFADITGRTPLDWYLATQFLPGEKIEMADASGKQSKGTLAHFKSAFPDDPCWI
ncbi:MAG: glycosyltransferase family 1 protein [Rhizobium sp.]|nr:glycosyltransferase family 1 protein [Rhizobium sp.]